MVDLNQSYWSVLMPLSENTAVIISTVPPLTLSSAATVVGIKYGVQSPHLVFPVILNNCTMLA